MDRVRELCRRLKPVLGARTDRLWSTYLADDQDGRRDIEQMLELLAAKHLSVNYEPDRSPFPPPPRAFACRGDLKIGEVAYGGRATYPFCLQSGRLKEHLLIAGRSGSGKTNLTFVLLNGMMERGIHILAIDWKRGYRDLLQKHSDLRVYSIGRDVSPIQFNPLIPPPGCEPHVWIKLTVDVISGAYLGGEGVISLLIGGLDHLYRKFGVYEGMPTQWPTVIDLLAWLRSAKLKGRAAMWQASAERILLALTYGEFGTVVNTQSNQQVLDLLDHNVVLEMDGLSSSSDRVLFSEALTLYLYRYRLAKGPQDKLTNVIVLEEAHNLLLAKQAGAKESVLETSIRMVRQYGLGYVFVDQSPSTLSRAAFANSYCTIALSQKLRTDLQTMRSAMNLSEEQRDALSTLPVGTAVVRLSDEFPEPFLIKVPLAGIEEGSIGDDEVRRHMSNYTDSSQDNPPVAVSTVIPVLPPPDKKKDKIENHLPLPTHPEVQTPDQSHLDNSIRDSDISSIPTSSIPPLSRETIRFLDDMITHPLSTTVVRYQRLHLTRRRGNAIRRQLAEDALIDSVPIATRSGQVILYELTESGRSVARQVGLEPRPHQTQSLEHRYWVHRSARHFQAQGYEITMEYQIAGNGAIDLVAQRGGRRVAVEVETGKSNIKQNLKNLDGESFNRSIMLATSPSAAAACHRAITERKASAAPVELWTWLDVS